MIAMRSRSSLVVVGAEATLRFEGDSAPFTAAALDRLRARPCSTEALAEHLARAAGAPVPRSIVDELVGRLCDARILTPATGEAPSTTGAVLSALAGRRIVLGVSGAIAAAGAPLLVELLQARGASVRVAMTRNARRFVSRRVLSALTHAPVPGWVMEGSAREPAPHIELAGWADAVVVAPASATTLGRIASGAFDDLVAAIALTTRRPVLVVPSMNGAMLDSVPVARNIETLVEDGRFVLEPGRGIEVAVDPERRRRERGAAPPPAAIARAVEAWFAVERIGVDRPLAWDAVHRAAPEGGHAWETDGLPADLAATLVKHAPPPASLCDLGCGTGAIACGAARRGYRVVGVDASGVALELAQRRPDASAVIWVRGDVTDPPLAGQFDVAVDRGTFHLLGPAERAAYARAVRRLVMPGGALVVVHDGPKASSTPFIHPFEPAAVAAQLEGFELVEAREVTLRRGEPMRAFETVLRRGD